MHLFFAALTSRHGRYDDTYATRKKELKKKEKGHMAPHELYAGYTCIKYMS